MDQNPQQIKLTVKILIHILIHIKIPCFNSLRIEYANYPHTLQANISLWRD